MARSDNICRTTSDAMSRWPLLHLKIHPTHSPAVAVLTTQSIGPGFNPVDPNSSPNVQVTHTVKPPTVSIHSLLNCVTHPSRVLSNSSSSTPSTNSRFNRPLVVMKFKWRTPRPILNAPFVEASRWLRAESDVCCSSLRLEE